MREMADWRWQSMHICHNSFTQRMFSRWLCISCVECIRARAQFHRHSQGVVPPGDTFGRHNRCVTSIISKFDGEEGLLCPSFGSQWVFFYWNAVNLRNYRDYRGRTWKFVARRHVAQPVLNIKPRMRNKYIKHTLTKSVCIEYQSTSTSHFTNHREAITSFPFQTL